MPGKFTPNPDPRYKKRKPPKRVKKKKAIGVGRPKGTIPPNSDDLAARKIDNGMVTRYITLNSHLTPKQLMEKVRTGKASTLESIIINCLLRANVQGDVFRLEPLLDRIVGKVPNKLEMQKPNPYDAMTLEELMELKVKLAVENEKTLRFLEETPRYLQREREVIEVKRGASNQSPLPPTGSDPGGDGSV